MTGRPDPRVSIALVIALAALALVAGLMFGAESLSAGAVFSQLLGGEDDAASIVRSLRAPRVVLAFGVGGALAVSGASLQALVRNPLAEPWLLGLSGGASLGAVLATVVGLPAGWSVAACATLGALAAAVLVYRISVVAGQRLDPRILLLAGVIVGSFATAVTTAILAVADPFTFRAATMWILGGFTGASWGAARDFFLTATLPLAALYVLARQLDLLALGDETATALGGSVDRTRRHVVLATSVLTAASVAAAGVIGFVGLVVPHAMRWIVGPMHRRLLPLVFIAGGAFTVLADTAARTVTAPSELPVGTITALVGVPLFALLLRRSLR